MAQKMDFVTWKRHVAGEIMLLCGMHPDDLNDWSYLDDYESGKTPKQCAKRAIKNAKDG